MHGGSVDKVCEQVLDAIRLKLKIRTKIGLYELIETFKHFVEDGKEAITLIQMKMVFEMMGFSFSEFQVRLILLLEPFHRLFRAWMSSVMLWSASCVDTVSGVGIVCQV